MKARFLTLILLSLSVLGVAAIDSYGATLTVTKTADTNDGACDTDCSLREALDVAAPGDTIVFSSLFNAPQTITLTLGQINITKNLTINGPSSDLVSVSGNNAGRIFNISGGVMVNMTGMKLRDGNLNSTPGGYGGGIQILDSTLNLTRMELTNNRAAFVGNEYGYGGGIYGHNCTLTCINVNFNHNTGTGGAVFAYAAVLNISDSIVSNNNNGGIAVDTVNMSNSTVSGNLVYGVGGQNITVANSSIMDNDGRGLSGGNGLSTTVTIDNSIISGNRDNGMDAYAVTTIRNSQIRNNTYYRGSGGGIINEGTMYIVNSAVTGNSAGTDGGGIHGYSGSGQLFITNSTVSGNNSFGMGGGIYLGDPASSPGRIVLVNSTITNNRSYGKGGGFRKDDGGMATFRNTIIAGNTSTNTNEADVSGVVISNGINLIGNTTGSSGWIAADLLNRDSRLAPLGNNGGGTFTHALLPGSPAINAGNNSLAVDPQTMLPLTTDQRGFARFIEGGRPVVDIGAYEAFYSSSPVTVSGRIVSLSGRGVGGVRVKLDDGLGNVVYTQTNPFGYYRFVNLTTGTTYTITVIHKYYSFNSPQFFTADQNRDDLNFIANFIESRYALRPSFNRFKYARSS